jgi:hypothetical protein
MHGCFLVDMPIISRPDSTGERRAESPLGAGGEGRHRFSALASDTLSTSPTKTEVGAATTSPATVHPSNGEFAAALVGAPEVRATAGTREAALTALESVITERLDQGELVALEIRRRGLTGLFGKYRDDPTLRDICEQAYENRDAGGAE